MGVKPTFDWTRSCQIHWKALATMIGAFGAGVLTAIGHHVFYSGLAGHPAPNDDYLSVLGWNVDQQQVNFAAGTALAFLAKAFLVLAISVSYIQRLWTAAKAKGSNEYLTISSLDAAFSVLGNLLSFTRLSFWSSNPLLLLLAATAWLIPLASIITPATLSVQSAPRTPLLSEMRYVPDLDFRSLAFSSDMTVHQIVDSPSVVSYNGPSLAVQRIVGATVLDGDILPIRSQWLNASWSIAFLGPSLSCTNVEKPLRTEIQGNIAHAIFGSDNCYSPPVYLSWFRPFSDFPYDKKTFIGKPGFTVASPYTATYSAGPSTLYIAVLPGMLTNDKLAPWNPADCGYLAQYPNNKTWTTPVTPTGPDDTIIVQCQLRESAYTVEFEYVNGTQQTKASLNTSTAERDFVPLFSIDQLAQDYELLRQISYQSVLETFSEWLVGSINNGVSKGAAFITNSNVLRTPILQAKEMSALTPAHTTRLLDLFNASDLNSLLSNEQYATDILDLSTKPKQVPTQPLTSIVEELFQNVTISLVSADELQPNISSSIAPGQRNVTFTAYRNVYVYSATKLWLAYGLALAFSALAIVLGLFAIWNNGASYSNEYSTILRTTLGADLSKGIFEKDMDGRDPLPSYMNEITVTFARLNEDDRKGPD